jgi:hypothetical protein
MARKYVPKVCFKMAADQAVLARDFIKHALQTGHFESKVRAAQKRAAQTMLEQLNMAIRMEIGNPEDDMRDHYDFSKGVRNRGKYKYMFENGYSITVHGPGKKSKTTWVPGRKSEDDPRVAKKPLVELRRRSHAEIVRVQAKLAGRR